MPKSIFDAPGIGPINMGKKDTLNDLDLDIKNDSGVESYRGTDRKTQGPFLAIQNFFENSNDLNKLWEEDREVFEAIQNEVGYWNEETLNLDIDLNKHSFLQIRGAEADIKDNPKPVHSIHAGNLGQDCYKWSAIVNCSSRDDIQGGELIFRDWQPPTRRDNYGNFVGDEDTCQPPWINEIGTLIIFPSLSAWGYHLVVSGGFKRVKIDFKGPAYK